jgi:hypothetical protein
MNRLEEVFSETGLPALRILGKTNKSSPKKIFGLAKPLL